MVVAMLRCSVKQRTILSVCYNPSASVVCVLVAGLAAEHVNAWESLSVIPVVFNMAAGFLILRLNIRKCVCKKKKTQHKEKGNTTLAVWVEFFSLRLTSLGFGEALMQAEDDPLYKVLDVSCLWPSDEHHPVMGEAFWCHFLPELSSVAELQLNLYCTLQGDGQTVKT